MSDLFISLDLVFSSVKDHNTLTLEDRRPTLHGCPSTAPTEASSVSPDHVDGVLADFERRGGGGASWFCTIA
uniref:Pheromone Phb3.1 B47 n=1 Tax=Coprinopsis cinerea TaxID=5346 RepID=Q6TMB1_COPCI|nr:pheromone precursor Phb3.1 B47 [Coprinopsis cinerea]